MENITLSEKRMRTILEEGFLRGQTTGLLCMLISDTDVREARLEEVKKDFIETAIERLKAPEKMEVEANEYEEFLKWKNSN